VPNKPRCKYLEYSTDYFAVDAVTGKPAPMDAPALCGWGMHSPDAVAVKMPVRLFSLAENGAHIHSESDCDRCPAHTPMII
jgi:hypothetical protein